MANNFVDSMNEFTVPISAISDDDVWSVFSGAVDACTDTRATSGRSAAAEKNTETLKGNMKSKEKGKMSSSRKSAKFSDLQNLEEKLVGEINARFSSFDNKFESFLGALSVDSTNAYDRQGRSSVCFLDSGTSGARRPNKLPALILSVFWIAALAVRADQTRPQLIRRACQIWVRICQEMLTKTDSWFLRCQMIFCPYSQVRESGSL